MVTCRLDVLKEKQKLASNGGSPADLQELAKLAAACGQYVMALQVYETLGQSPPPGLKECVEIPPRPTLAFLQDLLGILVGRNAGQNDTLKDALAAVRKLNGDLSQGAPTVNSHEDAVRIIGQFSARLDKCTTELNKKAVKLTTKPALYDLCGTPIEVLAGATASMLVELNKKDTQLDSSVLKIWVQGANDVHKHVAAKTLQEAVAGLEPHPPATVKRELDMEDRGIFGWAEIISHLYDGALEFEPKSIEFSIITEPSKDECRHAFLSMTLTNCEKLPTVESWDYWLNTKTKMDGHCWIWPIRLAKELGGFAQLRGGYDEFEPALGVGQHWHLEEIPPKPAPGDYELLLCLPWERP